MADITESHFGVIQVEAGGAEGPVGCVAAFCEIAAQEG